MQYNAEDAARLTPCKDDKEVWHKSAHKGWLSFYQVLVFICLDFSKPASV